MISDIFCIVFPLYYDFQINEGAASYSPKFHSSKSILLKRNKIYMQTYSHLFLLDLFNVMSVWINLRNVLDHLILLKCDAKYEGSTSYVYKCFMNIILPLSRLSLVTAYLDIYILVAHNFCFSEKVKHKKGWKEKVGKCRFFLYQHNCTVYLSLKIHRKLITYFAYQKMIMIIIRSCNQWFF